MLMIEVNIIWKQLLQLLNFDFMTPSSLTSYILHLLSKISNIIQNMKRSRGTWVKWRFFSNTVLTYSAKTNTPKLVQRPRTIITTNKHPTFLTYLTLPERRKINSTSWLLFAFIIFVDHNCVILSLSSW